MEFLPCDIVKYLSSFISIIDILAFCNTCTKLNLFRKPIVIDYFNDIKGVNTEDYTTEQYKILYLNYKFGRGKIVSKYNCTLIIRDNGEVYEMGLTGSIVPNMPLINNEVRNIIKVDIGRTFRVFLTKYRKVYIGGYMRKIIYSGIVMLSIENVIDILASEEYILMLLSNGKVMILGTTEEIKILPNIDDIKSLILHNNSPCLVSKEGKLLDITGKIISIEDKHDANIIDVSENKTLLLDNNGDVYIKINNGKKLSKLKGLKDIIYLYSASDNSFFVDRYKNVYVMGENKHRELGLPQQYIFSPSINMSIKF